MTSYQIRAVPILFSLLFLAVLVGCRDARPPETPPDVRAENTAPVPADRTPVKVTGDSRPVIVAFGDSLTAGYGTEAGQSYPDFLQRLLDEEHYRYRVENLGISGNTTKDGVERLKDVIALKPALVIVEFGGNDGLRGLPITTTRNNLDTIVHVLKEAGIPVALAGITLPPNYGVDYVDQFNKTYVLIAEKYKVPMLPFLLRSVYGVPGSMQEDQTHATAQGNQQVARNVLALVSPLLKRT